MDRVREETAPPLVELRIGLTEKFDREACQTIAKQEQPDQFARLIARLGLPEGKPQHREQRDPFQPGFVELARVAGGFDHAALHGVVEHDCPWHVGGLAPQFAVHEIGDPPEEQAERHRAGEIVMHAQPIEFLRACEQDDADRGADHPAVEGHAAIPQLEQTPGGQQLRRIEQRIAQPPAEDDAERGIEHQIIGMAARHRCARLAQQLQQIPPADQDAGDIGDRIPFDLEETQAIRPSGERDAEQTGPADGCRAGGADRPRGTIRLGIRNGRWRRAAADHRRAADLAPLFRALLCESRRAAFPGGGARAADLCRGLCGRAGRREEPDCTPSRCPRRPDRHRDAQFAVMDRVVHGHRDGGRCRDAAQRLVAVRRAGDGGGRGRMPSGLCRPAARQTAGRYRWARCRGGDVEGRDQQPPCGDAGRVQLSGASAGDARYHDCRRQSAGRPARDLAQRAAVPCHRRSAGVPAKLRDGAQTGADAEMGCRRSDAADSGGKDQLFRRCAADELRNPDAPQARRLRPVVGDGLCGGRRATPGRACPPHRRRNGRPQAAARLWPDRDQWRGLRQFPRQLPRQTQFDWPRIGTPGRSRDPGWCGQAGRAGRARRGRYPLDLQLHRILWAARCHRRRLHRRSLFSDRRHRLSGRGWVSVHRRPQEGHHHPRWREYLVPGSRGGDLRASGGGRGSRIRPSRRTFWRSAGRGGAAARGRDADDRGAVRIPVCACCRLQGAAAHLDRRQRLAAPGHREDRQEQGDGFPRTPEDRSSHAADRWWRGDRAGGRLGALAAALFRQSHRRQGRERVRRVAQDRRRWPCHRRRAAGRAWPGRLYHAAANHRRRAGRGLADRRGGSGPVQPALRQCAWRARTVRAAGRRPDQGVARGPCRADGADADRRIDLDPRI
ncbi:unnamed protein product [Rhizophagus irregularis]|uniref:Uncharacterized protein n=1 Tax=Rhizophagus irregularis TaxID=588596 RepID=A0A916E8E3_9GLOM|nr:unnamed protein product [Rhizophagus irregularis]